MREEAHVYKIGPGTAGILPLAAQPWTFFPPRCDVFEYDTREYGCGPGASSTWTK